MNRGDQWLSAQLPFPGNTRLGSAVSLAQDTWNRIMDDPSEVVITRRDPVLKKDVQLAPQLARIEIIQSIRSSGEQRDNLMTISKQYCIFIGLRDHPTLPNFDCLRADRIFYNQRIFEIVEYIDTIPGRLMFSIELTP